MRGKGWYFLIWVTFFPINRMFCTIPNFGPPSNREMVGYSVELASRGHQRTTILLILAVII